MLPCQKNCHAYCPGCHKSCPHFRAMQEQQHRDNAQHPACAVAMPALLAYQSAEQIVDAHRAYHQQNIDRRSPCVKEQGSDYEQRAAKARARCGVKQQQKRRQKAVYEKQT